jgi:hypothetical protein
VKTITEMKVEEIIGRSSWRRVLGVATERGQAVYVGEKGRLRRRFGANRSFGA